MKTQMMNFDLPAVADFMKSKKRYAAFVTTDDLKEQQLHIYNQISRFVNESRGGFFVFLGYAGTGKSYLINKYVEHYLAQNRTHQVCVTAPTNKAVRVSMNFAQYYHSNLSYRTIHSLLGLKEIIDDWGRQTFVRDPKAIANLNDIQLLILDEVSMLRDELFLHLPEYVAKGLKVIFVGDPCQINPIGAPEAMPLNPIVQKEYGMEVAQLTQIIRQTEGNPLIETTLAVRENIHRPVALPIKESKMVGNSGVVFLGQQDGNVLESVIEKYYTSDNYKANTDFVKVIAYTNKAVQEMNYHIRKYVFNNPLTKIVIGEKLLADKPIIYDMDKKIMFTTGDEFTVKEFSIKSEVLEGLGTLNYYEAKVECLDYLLPRTETIRIIHEDSEKLQKDILDKLRQVALSRPPNSFFRKEAWGNYYDFLNYYADVRHCYAVTAHKSQGSTYDTAIVFEGNIDLQYNTLERNKLKYTAFSRPSRLLLVVNS